MDQHTDVARPGGATAAAPRGARRPPRADGDLREHPARGVLPGWAALLVLLATGAGALLVQESRGGLPWWFPGSRAVNGFLRPDGPPLPPLLGAALLGLCALVALGVVLGLMANPAGSARVLSRWGRYRGTVRRTGLVWIHPLLKRHPVDVRVRHWRSEPITTADREGSPIRAELLLVWTVRDTARARFGVTDHQAFLATAAQAVLCRVAATLPCDSFASPGPCLRDGEWLSAELTRLLTAETAPVGIAVFSAQAVVLDYTEEFAATLRRRRLADLDAGTREIIVGDALETAALTVSRLERAQGVSFDDAGRVGLVRDLVASFLTLSPAAHAPAPAPGPAAAPVAGPAAAHHAVADPSERPGQSRDDRADVPTPAAPATPSESAAPASAPAYAPAPRATLNGASIA